MLSIGTVLTNYKNHLLPNWSGLASLFPRSYSGSISLLRFYVVFGYRQLSPPGWVEIPTGEEYMGINCYGNLWFTADGLGRWFFAWIYGDSYDNSYPRQAGLVFKFSPDDSGRGCIDTSRPPALTLSCHAGTDDVIKGSWPQMLSGGWTMVFQVPPMDLNPSDVWTEQGFKSFNPLSGVPVPPEEGAPSGSTLFPFPPTVPANALEPPYAMAPSPPQQPDDDGGDGGGVSFSTLDPPEDPEAPDIQGTYGLSF